MYLKKKEFAKKFNIGYSTVMERVKRGLYRTDASRKLIEIQSHYDFMAKGEQRGRPRKCKKVQESATKCNKVQGGAK